MNFEHLRLQTFSDWPQDAAVSPQRIAAAGFYYTRQDLTVQCFNCGAQIREWQYGDQVMTVHRRISPDCPFVKDPSTSGNISLPSRSQGNIRNSALHDEQMRLETFNGWPVSHIVTPDRLAKAGFYWLGDGDKTKCAYCNGVVGAWEDGDDPDWEHQRHFPNCSFVQSDISHRLGVNNTTSTSVQSEASKPTNSDNDLLRELGIQLHSLPQHHNYSTYESRLKSFLGKWPRNLIQTPESMAKAGFFYEGVGDLVRCYHCGGGLRLWDPSDDPWTEHARWFPKCPHLERHKTREFIATCFNARPEETPKVVNPTDEQLRALEQKNYVQEQYERWVQQLHQQRQHPHRQQQEPQRRYRVTERDIHAQMMTPEVLAALDVGLEVSRIRMAVKEKLVKSGTGFASATALIEATLGIQHEEEDEVYGAAASELTDAAERLGGLVLNEDEEKTESGDELDATAGCEKRKVEGTVAGERQEDLSLEEENRRLKELRLCKICMDKEMEVVFLPCGHMVSCVDCAKILGNCPVCRSTIKASVRVYTT